MNDQLGPADVAIIDRTIAVAMASKLMGGMPAENALKRRFHSERLHDKIIARQTITV